jgi:hypothetical protein
MTRCAVYRHYDAEGVLLYVGMTFNPPKRMVEHRCCSPWADNVARTEIDWFATREEAAEAERIAIKAGRPAANVLHLHRVKRVAVSPATALGRYINEQPPRKMGDWADEFGIARTSLHGLLAEVRSPGLSVATRIETVTGGAVPVRAWPKLAAVIAAGERGAA